MKPLNMATSAVVWCMAAFVLPRQDLWSCLPISLGDLDIAFLTCPVTMEANFKMQQEYTSFQVGKATRLYACTHFGGNFER